MKCVCAMISQALFYNEKCFHHRSNSPFPSVTHNCHAGIFPIHSRFKCIFATKL
jgi:hypothetical protein